MEYTKEQRTKLINTICGEIIKGRPLRSVLKDNNTPSPTTFYSWIDDNKTQLEQYTRACEARAESIFEDILDIADSQQDDIIILEDGKEVTNHEVIQRDRLRVDARKWILSKMQPKKYGEKLEIEQTNKGVIQYQNVSKQFPNKK